MVHDVVAAERVPVVLGVSLSAVLDVADNNSWFAVECCVVGIDIGSGVCFAVVVVVVAAAAERVDENHRLDVPDEACLLFRISLRPLSLMSRLRKHAQPMTKMLPFPPVASSFLWFPFLSAPVEVVVEGICLGHCPAFRCLRCCD
jgi:hypothetical protein